MIPFSSAYFEQLRNVTSLSLTDLSSERDDSLILQQPQPEPKVAEQPSTKIPQTKEEQSL